MVEHGTCLPPNRLHPTTFIDQLLPNVRLPTKEEASRRASHKTLPKSTRSKMWKMRKSLAALTCMVLAGTLGLSSLAWAQQKTVKACQEEWRADKTANQANGITEKAYVVQCRVGGTAAQPPPSIPTAQTRAAPPLAPSVPPVSSTVKPAPATTGSAAPVAANQFSTEAEAKGHCASDTVVWVNLHSKIYHYAGHKRYGKTKTGAYMCERETAAQGMRASKDEKPPG